MSEVLDVRGGATLREIRAMAGRAMFDGPHDYQTETLEGPLLDLAVANACGIRAVIHLVDNAIDPFYECCVLSEAGRLKYQFMPSRGWCQGGPLLEEYFISLVKRHDLWVADAPGFHIVEAPKPLVAAMRALVLSETGTVVHM